MTIRQTIRRATIVAATSAAVLALSSAPASAHVIVVEPSGNSETKVGMVGGGPLPVEYETGDTHPGLMVGGAGGLYFQSPSHGKGLNQACESLRAHGKAVVDIFGPPVVDYCPHGRPPVTD